MLTAQLHIQKEVDGKTSMQSESLRKGFGTEAREGRKDRKKRSMDAEFGRIQFEKHDNEISGFLNSLIAPNIT
jgi:hypothetical protein